MAALGPMRSFFSLRCFVGSGRFLSTRFCTFIRHWPSAFGLLKAGTGLPANQNRFTKIQTRLMIKRIYWIILLASALSACSLESCQSAKTDCSKKDPVQWVTTSLGCLHFYSYKNDSISSHPNLVIVLHGDAPFNNPGYQYILAKRWVAGMESACEKHIAHERGR